LYRGRKTVPLLASSEDTPLIENVRDQIRQFPTEKKAEARCDRWKLNVKEIMKIGGGLREKEGFA
jgi:hypothetical protein